MRHRKYSYIDRWLLVSSVCPLLSCALSSQHDASEPSSSLVLLINDAASGIISLVDYTITDRMACVCGKSVINVSYNVEISAEVMTVFRIGTKLA